MNSWLNESARPPTTLVANSEQQAEKERTAIAHHDACRVEVVGQEADAHAHGDDREQRSDVRHVEHVAGDQLLAVEKDACSAPIATHARSETVESVDQVDRLRHTEQPQHGHERPPLRRQQDRPVEVGKRKAYITTPNWTSASPARTVPATFAGGDRPRTSSTKPTVMIVAATSTPSAPSCW